MKRFICSLLILLFVTQAAQAAACYTPDQYRAEQAIRYHTRLMVVGMLCQRILDRNTYTDYQHFTTRNQNVIHNQENMIIRYFKQNRRPNPERALHSFRTDLANAVAQQAAASVGRFCQTYAAQWRESKAMQPNDFKAWIATISWKQPTETTRPVCSK